MTARATLIALIAGAGLLTSAADAAGPDHHRSRSHHGSINHHYDSGHHGYGYRHYSHRYGYDSHYGSKYRYGSGYPYRYGYGYSHGGSGSYNHGSYSYSYRAPYRSGYSGYSGSITYGSPSSRTRIDYAPARRITVEPTYTVQHDAGWDALMYGNAAKALDLFSDEASAYPRRGKPKLGYALASAQLGKLDQAVWAMRRAISYDHMVLSRVPYDPQIKRLLDELAVYYDHRVERYHDDSESWYMLAAIQSMQGDTNGARRAIDYAKRYGAPAADKLERAIAYKH